MNKRIAAVAAVVTLTATMAFAGPHEGRGGKGHGRQGKAAFGAKFAQELGLTADQQRLIQDIRKNSFAQNKDFFEAARAARKEMREARKSGDTARVDALKSQFQAQREQFKAIRAAERTQILTVLTADQRAKWDALKAEREANRGQRGNRRNRNRD